ncbi:MAG: hypothetical protein GWN93_01740 [Deltaproteobacteria bacterium]|nr:hypothetical protein [Deltaproteobacteria bacterium]
MAKLSPRLRRAALLEARGELTTAEIAERVKLSTSYLTQARYKEEYKLLVNHHEREIAERNYDAAAELQKKFNDEAPAAFETMAQLHKRADRDTTRLGAAKEILNRASIAPSPRDRRSEGDGGITIQLGVKKIEQIFNALEDVGDTETIQLLEGEYEEVE